MNMKCTNHVGNGVGFVSRGRPGFVVHPIEEIEILFESDFDGGDHGFGQWLRFSSETLSDEHGADGESHHVVGVGDAGSPRLLRPVRSHQELPQDFAGISKCLRQVR